MFLSRIQVESSGDSYLAVSGMQPPRGDHARAALRLALACHVAAAGTPVDTDAPEGRCVRLRVGLCTGPVCTGVAGHSQARFSIFGDTVNAAYRMEATGRAGAVQSAWLRSRVRARRVAAAFRSLSPSLSAFSVFLTRRSVHAVTASAFEAVSLPSSQFTHRRLDVKGLGEVSTFSIDAQSDASEVVETLLQLDVPAIQGGGGGGGLASRGGGAQRASTLMSRNASSMDVVNQMVSMTPLPRSAAVSRGRSPAPSPPPSPKRNSYSSAAGDIDHGGAVQQGGMIQHGGGGGGGKSPDYAAADAAAATGEAAAAAHAADAAIALSASKAAARDATVVRLASALLSNVAKHLVVAAVALRIGSPQPSADAAARPPLSTGVVWWLAAAVAAGA